MRETARQRRRHQHRQFFRAEPVIRIKKGQKFIPGCPDPGIAGGGRPKIFLGDISDFIAVGGNKLICPISGAVIYDQQLKIIKGLGKNRIYGLSQEMLAVIGRDYDTDCFSWSRGIGFH